MLAVWAKVSMNLSSARLEMGNALPDLALKSMLLYVPLLFFHFIPKRQYCSNSLIGDWTRVALEGVLRCQVA
jgi:hypothetical protein